jgi:hypothetical protein
MLAYYPKFCKRQEEIWETNETVIMGDGADWHSISYHPKAPWHRDPEREFERAYKQIQKLYKLFPDATYLIGNHSALPKRRAEEIGLPENVLRNFTDLWGVPNWNIVPRYGDHIIDGVIYRHGDKGKGGQRNAAYANAVAEFKSVVQGHFHAQLGVEHYANASGCVFGMQVGCGVDHSVATMDYGKRFNAKPIVGCGVVLKGVTAVPIRMLKR